jgi:hypothetical protein
MASHSGTTIASLRTEGFASDSRKAPPEPLVAERSATMFWHRDTPAAPRMTDSDVRCTLLLAAMRAFREAEAQNDLARREGPLMAEFAELVVLPEPPRGA